ncbi:MAG: nucleotide exchange factor GrpE [Ruminococcaceae bacterium]|nr:nucleotide exchange factor GrpE [Oscillospiraceae bacterium]
MSEDIKNNPAADPVEETVETPAEETAAAEPTAEEKLAAELADMQDRYKRMLAEYDNFRKRSQKEKESVYDDATIATAAIFLQVLDNLDRALAQPTTDEAYKKGVEMIHRQFCECLSKLKITEAPGAGEQFDPNIHNAVMHVEDESCDDNTIIEVFQKGFLMGDRVVRHSMVKVAN